MLKSVKRSVLAALHSAGLFDRLRVSRWRQNRLAILCYHGISLDDEHVWNPSLYLSPAEFRARMELLRLHRFAVLALPDAIERLRNGSLPPAAVAITFDDGTRDFHARALPILRAFGFPATVYLRTDYCGSSKTAVNPMLSYLFWKRRDAAFDFSNLIGCHVNLVTHQGRTAAWRSALDFIRLRNLSDDEQQAFVETLAGRLGLDYAALRARGLLQIMPPGEVAEAFTSGMNIELHTHSHRSPLDRDLFYAEIEENRRQIERITGLQPRHFCYPSGVYRPEFLPWLAALNVISATTCEAALASRRTHSLLLPRFIDNGFQSALEFESWLTGASALLPRNGLYNWRKRRWQNQIQPLTQ